MVKLKIEQMTTHKTLFVIRPVNLSSAPPSTARRTTFYVPNNRAEETIYFLSPMRHGVISERECLNIVSK